MGYKINEGTIDLSKYKLDIQFLASLIHNPKGLTSLEKEVSINDFSETIFFDIYEEIVDFILKDRIVSVTDLRFKFSEDSLVIEILDIIEAEEMVADNLSIVYALLCNKARTKQLLQLGKYITKHAEESEVDMLIGKVEEQLLQVTMNSAIKLTTVNDLEGSIIKSLNRKVKQFGEKGLEGIVEMPTGISALDRYTLGLQRKNVWVISASSSMGKTQLAVFITNNVMKANVTTLFFLLEDSEENLIIRFCALRTGITITKIRTGNLTEKEYKKILDAISSLGEGERLLIEDSLFDINDIVTKIRFAKLKYPELGSVVIDHIGLCYDRNCRANTNREQEVKSISNRLTAVSKECNVAIINVQQLNTNPDTRKSGFPVSIADLRESKSTGHDARVVIALNAPNKDSEEHGYSKEAMDLLVVKNTHGESNKKISLINNAATGRFLEGKVV